VQKQAFTWPSANLYLLGAALISPLMAALLLRKPNRLEAAAPTRLSIP